MKHFVVIVCLTLLVSPAIFAQPDIEWERNYGGAGAQFGEGLVVSPQGGYAICGASGGGSNQIWLCRVDAEGEEQWNQTYDLEGQSNHCYDLCMTNDNGFLLVGSIMVNDTYGWYVMRIDQAGDVVWARSYYQGNGGRAVNWAYAVAEVQSDQYIVAGILDDDGQSPDGLAILIEGDGDVIWEAQVGGGQSQGFMDVVVAPGGYALCGNQTENGDRDAWLVKLDQNGQVDWQERYGVEQMREAAWGLTVTRDDGYGIIAWTTPDNEVYDSFIIHTNGVGEVLWEHVYEREGRELGYAIIQNADRGFTYTGQRDEGQRYYVGYVQNTDIDGNPTWDMGYGEPFFYSDSKDIVFDPAERATLVCGTTYAGNNQELTDASLAKVAQINHPPEIVGQFPPDSIVVFITDEDTTFSVEAIDVDDDSLAYRWTLDGDTIAQEEIFLFTANALGVHYVACYVNDGEFTVSTEWEVRVYQMISNFIPLQTNFDGSSDTTVFFAILPGVPFDSLRVSWSHNAEVVSNDTSTLIQFSAVGEHIVRADAEWFGRRDSVIWTIEIVTPDTNLTPRDVSAPEAASLLMIHPNPFNSTTTIRFGLSSLAPTRIAVYGLDGRLVQDLVNSRLEAGEHSVIWNAEGMTAGIYLVKMETLEFSEVRKVTLIR